MQQPIGTTTLTGTLYLIPASLGAENIDREFPPENARVVKTLQVFIVENIRTARRFLRKTGYDQDFDQCQFFVLNKHTPLGDIPGFLDHALQGGSVGLLSEAGCPCIADPGQLVVRQAHRKGIRVVPLVGPSSILMALIASGFNGQSFSFHGYLPMDKKERMQRLRNLEQMASQHLQTQIFMETPFRNNALIQDLFQACREQTLLCIASNLTLEDEYIYTAPLSWWKKNTPDLNKKPSVFLIFCP